MMDGTTLIERRFPEEDWTVWKTALAADIDVAIAAERDRCVDAIWEFRGCCVSDESARALMEHVRQGDRRGL